MNRKEQIVVLGGGESGTGAALLAAHKGYAVFLSEKTQLADAYRQQLVERGIPFEEGGHTLEKILNADKVIKSPGIPDNAPIVAELRQKGVPVVDELSFALDYTPAKVIAITGTNGKTTTTLLTYHLLKEAGLKVGLAGNVGYSLAALLAAGNSYDWLVLEVSSFQLDGMPGFRPYTGILLNITPDHLDRYEYRFENYVASKMQLCSSMHDDDALIFNAEDPVIAEALRQYDIKAQMLPVAASGKEAAANLDPDWIRIKGPVRDTLYPHSDIVLRGRHNYLNTACAVLAAYRAGVSEASISQSLQSFKNAPHRLEKVGETGGVEWINDSKATNVDAAWYALDAMQKPVVWIAGGTDKGNDYDQLQALVRQKVKALVCMGKDNEKLLRYFNGIVPILYDTHSLEEAMQKAAEAALPGDVVLLAPACASFDLFKNYIDRGDQFRKKVDEIKNSR
ncbi:UDP-N-acetylmuramoyl-L-alanine--D-glutamate ligase [Cesiribacter sp. SM1]|uniref:UDP-N-acetylmuramoyl-L-alanine--D-glutamate ligase n=1 Tax=Cesiribacter sp. SM1 TaxID=2861196 RepID=UPI001CD3B65D|nr:UDP-N-acetylmuramoyl-L-alanine--D-glutamate ligase [Cesiribacter sp. SM1]